MMSKGKSAIKAAQAESAARHRSGAVARMLRMPVATLRVWERRYQLTQAELSASGQRLYSASDVQRLALLKRLSDLGHAIGSLAALDMQQLHEVAATHARALAQTHPAEVAPATGGVWPSEAWRLAVICSAPGNALCKQLQSPELLRRLSRPVQLLGPFGDATQAEAALQGLRVDALLVQAPHVQTDWLAGLQSNVPTLAALPRALLYRFAPDAACAALVDAGTLLLREPQSDSALGQWLQGLLAASVPPASPAAPNPATDALAIAPRRWDDAALADFAGLSSTVACECPRHVAELLMQLAHFETYSAECEDRSPSDAQLHRYLRHVAARSRASFEAALEHIALHEGLTLPSLELTLASTPEVLP
jgi:DNA-binding transcriptional MerR regulator